MDWEEKFRKYMAWAAVLLTGSFAFVVLTLVIYVGSVGFWNDIAQKHVPSILGLPCAALASLVLVLVLRTVSGNIELEVLGFKFKGAAGPIIMWILCFLAITLGIVKTWDLGIK